MWTAPTARALSVAIAVAAAALAGCGEPIRVEAAPVRLFVAADLPGAEVAELAGQLGIARPVLVPRVEEAEVAWLRDPAAALDLGPRAAEGNAPAQPGFPSPFLDPRRRFAPVGAIASVLVLPAAKGSGFEPRKLADLADPRLRGRVALARLDAGGGPLLAATLEAGNGERGVRGFLERLAGNRPIVVRTDAEAIARVARGEAAVALADTRTLAASPERAGVRFLFPDQVGAGCVAAPTALVVLPEAKAPARRLAAWLTGREAEQMIADRALGLIPLRPEATAVQGFEPMVNLVAQTSPWDPLPALRREWTRRLEPWPRLPRGSD
jgi:iron(III) transport system substrate-binding protein